jgi:hypothetical protein
MTIPLHRFGCPKVSNGYPKNCPIRSWVRANQIGAAHARLFLPVDAATEQKSPMLLECAEALFERMEQ